MKIVKMEEYCDYEFLDEAEDDLCYAYEYLDENDICESAR